MVPIPLYHPIQLIEFFFWRPRLPKLFKLSALLVFAGVIFSFTPTQTKAFEPQVLNSVVSVLPDWPRGKQEKKPSRARMSKAPEGSAVAIFPGGYLITNAHVIGNAKEVDIRLNDGRLVGVEIVGRDLRTDLALLKAPQDFPVLEPAPIPEPGASVCAIGNQFGLGLSVTCGVVSAVHRTGTGFNPVENFVQTDAAINPGGSGGALVDARARLVGVVSAIFTKESDSNIGINFVTSIDLITRVATDIRDHGRVIWAKSGFRVAALTMEQRRETSGARVVHVAKNGPGEKAGLKTGDIVTRVGSRQIIKPTDVVSTFAAFRSGDQVSISYVRDKTEARASLILD